MEIADLEQLVQMVRDSDAAELTLRNGDARITIRKSPKSSPVTGTADHDDAGYAFTTQVTEIVEEDEDGEQEAEPTRLVTAPLVGVFGHVKPLVGLHARVVEDQVVGTIEAMKLMTEIKAPASGTIVDIFIEDGHPVEYGQALFEIRPEEP